AETTEQRRAYRQRRARMYFIRVLMSHVYEALTIIDEINKSDELRDRVAKCDSRTQQNFAQLVAILNSPERGHLYRFRSKATFHYDPKVTAEHLQKTIEYDLDAVWSYSVGSTSLDWHFELSDAVMDRMVVRYVFGADEDRSPARREKVREIATRLDAIATQFTDFASHFIQQQLR
ncbi:MAG: hypothetical protein WAV18_16885, partial [Roseiarcus sp.]